MSYILEALKKSESERQQANSPPSIYTPKPPPIEPDKDVKKSRFLLYSVLVVFFLMVVAMGYHLYGKKMISITITVPQENANIKHQNTTEKAEPVPGPVPELTADSSAATYESQPADPKTVVIESDPEQPGDERAEIALPKTTPVETVSKRPHVPRLEEMDEAFRKKVPDFKLAGHVYSEDAGLRMILINNRIVRENGAAAKDFILEEITPNGIILRNGTVRFRIDIP